LDEFLGQVVLVTEGKDKIILDDETHPLETKKKKGGGIETMPGNLVITFRYKTGQQLEREAKEAKELAIKKKERRRRKGKKRIGRKIKKRKRRTTKTKKTFEISKSKSSRER